MYLLTNIEIIHGTTDNPIIGKVINNQNCIFDNIALVLSQKNTPLCVILISSLLYTTTI
jgi:hypothetical protein